MRLVRELPYGSNIGMKVGQPCEPPDLDGLVMALREAFAPAAGEPAER